MRLKYFAPAILFFLAFTLQGQDVKVMTYNIKYDNVSDTVNNWNDRKHPMVDLINKFDPGVIGMQEVLFRQLQFLNESMPHLDYVGVGREDGKEKGEFSPIFYNTQKFELLKSGTFWLSTTPDEVSIGWDAALERICTYALFKTKDDDKRFWVFNTHFDHRGVKARKKSVKLILKKIKAINREKLPVVLMGDLNLQPEQQPIELLAKKMTDGLLVAEKPNKGPIGTFNGFNLEEPINRRIDYIFTEGFTVRSYSHIDERLPNGKHVSDHLPVIAELSH
ncbi:Metal-dependent hydrolase, endonuclease/exonuclease/phosphatase family [Pseudozobellia thermophila]|uniref:Metal-dependent hydrolase, endonuclease/exonuclease/phosphatase family n=2 Tax=Pseudozobellia thermophila TaxID=192903 RepID=A0A1M6FMA8_9FLAO|nr:Metal-dependent hydrolase, endonuclease/exonuclease/phosphatase family [Pseudozobellia thermophila]